MKEWNMPLQNKPVKIMCWSTLLFTLEIQQTHSPLCVQFSHTYRSRDFRSFPNQLSPPACQFLSPNKIVFFVRLFLQCSYDNRVIPSGTVRIQFFYQSVMYKIWCIKCALKHTFSKIKLEQTRALLGKIYGFGSGEL